MTNNNKKKSSKEKRVLIGALCVAAVMVAGSTFAWFTSKDEVTNRLSASASYGTTISEDFTPPENWIPGQEIDKKVGVTNTGNIDAFVRTWIEGEMRLSGAAEGVKSTGGAVTGTFADVSTPTAAEKALSDAGYTKKIAGTGGATDTYYRVLKTSATTNNTTTSNDLDEVVAIQAGGFLAFCPTDAEYEFEPNDITTASTVAVDYNKVVAGTGSTTGTQYITAGTKGIAIDSESFKPKTTGLYIFRRNVEISATSGADEKWEYSGYYYVEGSGYGDGTYYALKTKLVGADGKTATTDGSGSKSVYLPGTFTTAADGSVTLPSGGLELDAAQQKVLKSKDLYWSVDDATTPTKVIASTATKTDGSNTVHSGVIINIALDAIGTDADKWAFITGSATSTVPTKYDPESAQLGKFYYTNDLEEGKTTTLLVKSVTLDSSVTQNDYIDFDFDLNVFMDSVQVTKSSDGSELDTAINATEGKAFETNKATGGATGAAETDASTGEITKITWTVATS